MDLRLRYTSQAYTLQALCVGVTLPNPRHTYTHTHPIAYGCYTHLFSRDGISQKDPQTTEEDSKVRWRVGKLSRAVSTEQGGHVVLWLEKKDIILPLYEGS